MFFQKTEKYYSNDPCKVLDQVEGEGWVDKNAALRGWAYFTSHGCKL